MLAPKPEPGTRIPDRLEPDAYWLVCEGDAPGLVIMQLMRPKKSNPEEFVPATELPWPVDRWRTFLDRHAVET